MGVLGGGFGADVGPSIGRVVGFGGSVEEDWDLMMNWCVGLVVGKWRRGEWRWKWGSLGRREDEVWNISAIFYFLFSVLLV